EKIESQRSAVRRQELDTVIRLVADLTAQRLGPEAREPQRLVRVEAQCDEPRRHVVRHPVFASTQKVSRHNRSRSDGRITAPDRAIWRGLATAAARGVCDV